MSDLLDYIEGVTTLLLTLQRRLHEMDQMDLVQRIAISRAKGIEFLARFGR